MSNINRNLPPKKSIKDHLKSTTTLYYLGLMVIFISGIIIALYVASAGGGAALKADNPDSDAPLVDLSKLDSDQDIEAEYATAHTKKFKPLEVPPSNDYQELPPEVNQPLAE